MWHKPSLFLEVVKFGVSHILMKSALERVISFSWSQSDVTGCALTFYHFIILSSSCGNCPSITNQTNVNCTDVPADAERCLFVLIPNVCGGPLYHSSTIVHIDLNPNRGTQCIDFLCIIIWNLIVYSWIFICNAKHEWFQVPKLISNYYYTSLNSTDHIVSF